MTKPFVILTYLDYKTRNLNATKPSNSKSHSTRAHKMKLYFGGTKINYILLITFLQLSSRKVTDVCLPCTAGGVGRQLLGIWHWYPQPLPWYTLFGFKICRDNAHLFAHFPHWSQRKRNCSQSTPPQKPYIKQWIHLALNFAKSVVLQGHCPDPVVSVARGDQENFATPCGRQTSSMQGYLQH